MGVFARRTLGYLLLLAASLAAADYDVSIRNARVLVPAEYVRVRGVLTLEDAVRRMTSLPARTFGLSDRGLVREGMAADLVLFDSARVLEKSTYAQPHQYSQGFGRPLGHRE